MSRRLNNRVRKKRRCSLPQMKMMKMRGVMKKAMKKKVCRDRHKY